MRSLILFVAIVAAVGFAVYWDKQDTPLAGAPGLYPPIFVWTENKDTANTMNTICRSGWTSIVRPDTKYTTPIKLALLKQSSFKDRDPSHYELDHAAPIELLGDPTNPKNLWLEPITEARQKDRVETYLKNAVCADRLTLAQAQDMIAANWITVYQTLSKQPTFGSVEPSNTDD